MILLNLNKKSKTPIFKQILFQLTELIEKGVLKPGDKLPSTRSLANHHQLNRNTVYKAYEELWALGYIESKTGSYSTIRERKNIAEKLASNSENIDWSAKINSKSQKLIESNYKIEKQEKDYIDFTPLSPDPDVIPSEEFRKCINDSLKNSGSDILAYGNPYGYEPLREFISNHMQLHGINVTKDEIIVTSGAQHAIELILKLFIEPGSEVLIESPTYSAIIPLLEYYDVNVLELPMSEHGIDLQILESLLKTHKPKLLYTMPNFHNPTGITTNQAHREKLLEICERYEIPVIEDGFVEEMKYFGKNILPVKSMDKSGLVFYVGTFSKVLFPGIRIGWIASNKYCTDRFAEQIKASAISVNQLNQVALELYCKQGLFEKQLKRIHTLYRKRMYVALKTIRENLTNKNITYTKPAGGYTIWFETMKSNISESDLVEKLKMNGIQVMPGSKAYYSQTDKISFRISIAHRKEDEIEKGLEIITQILNKL
ncbi:MAG: PLP-dependent aminotransferase family protein [Bacteroidetes bacterium]|nr:PLP-dependent aminotransferase family protein [Bacteroidota bacterium]